MCACVCVLIPACSAFDIAPPFSSLPTDLTCTRKFDREEPEPAFFWVKCKAKHRGARRGCAGARCHGDGRAVFSAVVSLLPVLCFSNSTRREEWGPFPRGREGKWGNISHQRQTKSSSSHHEFFSLFLILVTDTIARPAGRCEENGYVAWNLMQFDQVGEASRSEVLLRGMSD